MQTYRAEIWQKTIVTLSKIVLERTNTIRPEHTRWFNIKILSTIIRPNNVHVIDVKHK